MSKIGAQSLMPFLGWRDKINPSSIKSDIVSGITGAIIVVPQGVAFALIAGLPPEYGLYTAIVPTIIAALFGSSFHLISGPTTAISIVIFTTISPFADPSTPEFIEMVLTITFMAGLFQFALGLAKLGALVNFVSHSVVVGFTAGAAILIASSQIFNLTGIHGTSKHSFTHIWSDLVAHLPEANLHVLAVGLVTLGVAVAFKVLLPRWPGLLVAMVSGSIFSLMVDGASHGVSLVGSLPAHLPGLTHPSINATYIRELAPGALAIAILGLTEAVSISRSIASMSEQRIDSNQEFVGQGLSNMIGCFFSAYASSGSFTRTGVNYNAGARTPMSAIFSALFLALIIIFIAPLTAYLPLASMAGILLLVAYNLIDFHHIKSIVRASRSEAAVLGVTFLATLFTQLQFAVYAGVMLSLMLYLNRTSHPSFITLAPDPDNPRKTFTNVQKKPLMECPQLKVFRVDGSIFFGAANHISLELDRMVNENPERAHLLLVGSGINFIDASGCQMLAQEAHRLKLYGRQLYMCSLKSDVRQTMERGGCGRSIGLENLFTTKHQAIRTLVPRLDPELCRVCTARLFNECPPQMDELT